MGKVVVVGLGPAGPALITEAYLADPHAVIGDVITRCSHAWQEFIGATESVREAYRRAHEIEFELAHCAPEN